jgi:hypothetical protein
MSEAAGAIVIYDLPSGYTSAIKDERLRTLFIRARTKCSNLLRRNGINITEGVLLVPKEKVPEAEGAIRAIQMIYLRLWKKVEEMGTEELAYDMVEPLLLVVRLTEDQFQDFKLVARKRLLESYNTVMDYMAEAAKKTAEAKSREELEKLKDRVYNRLEFFRRRALAVASIVPEAEQKLKEVEEAARAALRAASEAAQRSP